MGPDRSPKTGKASGAPARQVSAVTLPPRRGRGLSTNRNTKAAAYAVEAIRTRILEGLLSPGQRLIESELMAELDVGRSTLREAWLRLEADGLVELRHQRGAIVRRLSRRDMAELFEVRACLEGFGAALAAARIDQDGRRKELEAERQRWEQETVLANAVDFMAHNVELHRLISATGDNVRLMQILAPLQMPGYRLQFLRLLDLDYRRHSAKDHLAIIDAVLEGDSKRAEHLMRQHILEAGRLAQQIPDLLDR